MRILIVGSAGYVGGYMYDLLGKKHSVSGYDNLLYETRYLKPGHFIYGDVRDKEKLSKIIPEYNCVVWLSGVVGDGACQVNPELTNEINFESVKWLVDNYKDKFIVFPSTCSVYGVNDDLIDETAEPNPLSIYASTKLAAERYVVENAKDYLIFRLGTLYGISDTYSRLRLDLVTNVLTKKAVKGEDLSVFGGDQWRPLLHVKDVSHAVDYCIDNKVRGLFNLSSINVTIKDMAKEIQKVIPGTKITFKDLKFEDLRNYRVDNSKILATGWRPQFNLHDGIAELKKVFEENRVADPDDSVYSNAAYLQKIWK